MTESRTDIRELSLALLLKITEEKTPSHEALSGALEKYQYLGKQDRAFLTRLTEGTLERLIELDDVLGRFSSVPVKKMKPVIRAILRMAVYQILYMDGIPDRAAVSEAVRLTKKKGFAGLAGFVNGVLRGVLRGLPLAESEDLSVRYSTPAWIVEQWTAEYGRETAIRMLEAQYEERPVTVRVNTARITREALMRRLESEGAGSRAVEEVPCALELLEYDYLRAVPSFREGLFQVQDVSSMRTALLAAPKPGDYCIDVCAAPGGKSLHLAELLGGSGMVEARDLTDAKVARIRENIERLGAENIRAVRMDATVFDPASEEKADVLLADLPCSGLGVLNKKRDLKYRMTPGQQEELVRLQRTILDTVWRYVKPGGTLIYSTCTVHKEENEGNAAWFAANYPFALKEELQTLPGVDPCDGFYIARLERNPHD